MQDDIQLPEHLRNSVLLGIRAAEKKQARRHLVVAGMVMLASIGVIVASVQYALLALSQTSFYAYASLLFSDTDVVLQYWREFGLVLLESLPVVGIVACLIAIFALLLSLRVLARNTRFVFTPSFSN